MEKGRQVLRDNCRGWVLIEYQTRHYEGDCYGIFHVSDILTNRVRGFDFFIEEGICRAHPYFDTEAERQKHPEIQPAACVAMVKTLLYRFGYEFWEEVTFYPLDKWADLERKMYELKYISKENRELRLMRGTELRP